jgi:hypothetical protein
MLSTVRLFHLSEAQRGCLALVAAVSRRIAQDRRAMHQPEGTHYCPSHTRHARSDDTYVRVAQHTP